MQIEMPNFCDNCKQYQRLDGTEYCKRCAAIVVIEATRPTPQAMALLALAILVISAAILLVLYLGSDSSTTLLEQHTANVTETRGRE